MLFLSDICRPFQVIFPGSLLLTAASFRLVLSLPLGMLCCYWYAMRWQWDGWLPPNVSVVPGCAAPGERRFGPDFSMNAPIAKHIIDNFVNETLNPDIITVGINSLRVCTRKGCPKCGDGRTKGTGRVTCEPCQGTGKCSHCRDDDGEIAQT